MVTVLSFGARYLIQPQQQDSGRLLARLEECNQTLVFIKISNYTKLLANIKPWQQINPAIYARLFAGENNATQRPPGRQNLPAEADL